MDTQPIIDHLRPIILTRGQAAVAAEAGISQGMLSLWLAGKKSLSPANLASVAAACGFTLDYRLRRRRRLNPES